MKVINTVKTAIRWDKSIMIFAENEWKHIGLADKNEAWYLGRPEPEVETDPPLPPYSTWDKCDVYDEDVKFRMEEDPRLNEETAREESYESSYVIEDAWDDFCVDLTNGMKEVNPDCNWTCDGRNLGWRHLSGSYKGGEVFHSETGEDLLGRILPETECTFKVYIDYDGTITISNSHHDVPYGGELYFIKPVKETADG